MAEILGNPFSITNARLTLGANNYTKVVNQVEITTSSTSSTFTAIDGTTYTSSGADTFNLVVQFFQDWGTVDSMSRFTWEHARETVPFTYQPNGEDGALVSGVCTIVRPGIGGTSNTDAVTTLTFGIQGVPDIDFDYVPVPEA